MGNGSSTPIKPNPSQPGTLRRMRTLTNQQQANRVFNRSFDSDEISKLESKPSIKNPKYASDIEETKNRSLLIQENLAKFKEKMWEQAQGQPSPKNRIPSLNLIKNKNLSGFLNPNPALEQHIVKEEKNVRPKLVNFYILIIRILIRFSGLKRIFKNKLYSLVKKLNNCSIL